jgi:hypothetical protein
MENAYGIGITNRFGCFLRREGNSDSEEETDEVLLKSPESAVPTKPKVKIAEKENNRTENKVDTSQKTDKSAAGARNKGIRDSNQKGNEQGAAKGGGVGGVTGNRNISSSAAAATTADGGGGQQKLNRGPRPERPPYDKERSMNKFFEEGREDRNNRRNREEGNRYNNNNKFVGKRVFF